MQQSACLFQETTMVLDFHADFITRSSNWKHSNIVLCRENLIIIS